MSMKEYISGAIEQRSGNVKRLEAVVALRKLGAKGLESSKGILTTRTDDKGNTVVSFRSAKTVARFGFKGVTDAKVAASLVKAQQALAKAQAWTVGVKPVVAK